MELFVVSITLLYTLVVNAPEIGMFQTCMQISVGVKSDRTRNRCSGAAIYNATGIYRCGIIYK